jgi:hypothetical protein
MDQRETAVLMACAAICRELADEGIKRCRDSLATWPESSSVQYWRESKYRLEAALAMMDRFSP